MQQICCLTRHSRQVASKERLTSFCHTCRLARAGAGPLHLKRLDLHPLLPQASLQMGPGIRSNSLTLETRTCLRLTLVICKVDCSLKSFPTVGHGRAPCITTKFEPELDAGHVGDRGPAQLTWTHARSPAAPVSMTKTSREGRRAQISPWSTARSQGLGLQG